MKQFIGIVAVLGLLGLIAFGFAIYLGYIFVSSEVEKGEAFMDACSERARAYCSGAGGLRTLETSMGPGGEKPWSGEAQCDVSCHDDPEDAPLVSMLPLAEPIPERARAE